MSQIIVCDNSCEDTKYLIDFKEEPVDGSSVTDIDCIKQDSFCATIKDEIYIKEETLDNVAETDFNFKIESPHPLESNVKVGDIKNSFTILLL